MPKKNGNWRPEVYVLAKLAKTQYITTVSPKRPEITTLDPHIHEIS